METVYKYCDEYGVKILQNLELKITPPNQFNDPFEFTPRVICSSPNRSLKKIFGDKSNTRAMFLEYKRQGKFKGSAREFRKYLREMRPTLVPAFAEKIPEATKEMQTTYLDAMSKLHGVLCLSTRRNSIVMWGHYGDKHQGLVIGLDSTWTLFQSAKGLHPVNYGHRRALWDTSWKSGSTEENVYLEQLVFSKNDEWRYEDELRQLFNLSGLRKHPLSNGVLGHFLPIPPEIILTVSLGQRCPSALENSVRIVLSDPRLSHVKLDRAVLHESDFDLGFEERP